MTGMPTRISNMRRIKTDAVFDWYETELVCKDESSVFYSFLIAWKGKYIHYRRTGAAYTDSVPFPDPAHSYALLEDVTVFIQPWQAKVNLRTGKAKTDITLDDATIPAGASVTVVGEMKDKYQILYGDAASGWHVTAMAPASQITLTAFSANVRGPAAQGFALLPKNDIDPDNEIDTLVSTASFPGDTWQEGEAYTDRRLAEIHLHGGFVCVSD